MRHLGGAQTEEQIQQAHAKILQAISHGGWCFKIVPELDGPVAGTVLIWKSTWRNEAIHEMGWMILPEFQGHGIASRAVQSLLSRASDQSAFRAVHAFPAVDNLASNRICERCGFSNIEQCHFEYSGNELLCNHWQIRFDQADSADD